MKKLFIMCCTLLISQLVFSQTESIDRLVRKVKRDNRGAEKVDISLPGWLVRFGTNFIDEDDLDGFDVKMLGRKLGAVRIFTLEGKRQIQKSDIQDFMTDVRAEGFDELLTVRDKSDEVRILIRERKDLIRNIVIVVDEKSEGGDFVLLSLEGKFSMDDINKMMEHAEFNGHSVNGKAKNKVKTIKSED
jgi:Domain of unknown function (DUF4252)